MSDVHELARIVNESGLGLKGAYKAGLLPATDKTVSKQLKKGGYAYNTSTKQWQLSETAATITTSELLPAATVILNDDELAALKQLAQQFIGGNIDITPYVSADIELYKRTLSIDKANRDRKTFVISKNTALQFDELATRVNLDKSDLLELALADFLQRYNNS